RVVAEDHAVSDVLRLEEVEDDRVVPVVFAVEVEVRVSGPVAELARAQRALEDDLEHELVPRGRRPGDRARGVLEAAEGFDADGAGGHGELRLPGRVERAAEVADGGLRRAVPAGLRMGPEVAERREPALLRLVEVAAGANDVHPAGRGEPGVTV